MNRLAALRSRMPAWLLPVLALLAAVVGALAVAGAGPGFQVGVVGLSGAFSLIRFGVVLASIGAVVGLVALLTSFLRGGAPGALVAVLALAVAVPAVWLPWNLRQQAAEVPPIHDITTDTDNPPAFVAIAPLRRDAPNPVEYAGRETARAQHEAYPDIRPMYFDAKPVEVFRTAKQAISELGWQLVDADENDGRIEAIDTTRWFGFRDDIVIRIQADNGGTRMDVRSKSRVGRSDVGTNARRIRAFRDTMQARLPAQADTNKPDTIG